MGEWLALCGGKFINCESAWRCSVLLCRRGKARNLECGARYGAGMKAAGHDVNLCAALWFDVNSHEEAVCVLNCNGFA